MRHLARSLALVLIAVGMAVTTTAAPATAAQPEQCESGPNRVDVAPTPPSHERAKCNAKATRSDAGARGKSAKKDQPAPNPGYDWLGAQTSNWGSVGIFGALNVVDPAVPRYETAFLAHRIMAKSCDSARWIEVGWAEVSWRDNRQYIYSYNTVTNTWMFFDQFPIVPGSRIWVDVIHIGNDVWQAQLWWNGAWQTLATVNAGPGIGCGNEQYVEPYKSYSNFSFPTITTGDGTTGGMQLSPAATAGWVSWNQSIPTVENNSSGDGYYTTSWTNRYHRWQVRSNRPPVASLYVSPSTGQARTTATAGTTFYADLYDSYDPEGSALTYRIYWGDGSTTYGRAGSHAYSSTGLKTITATVTDNWGQTSYDTYTVRVCQLYVSGVCA